MADDQASSPSGRGMNAPKPANSSSPARTADEVLAALDANTGEDALVLVELMRRVSGHEPIVWNVATLGFDTYHYRYESGREGDLHVIGFYPRKGKLTIYLMDGTDRHAEQLARLGKHTTGKVCLYLRRLTDVDLAVLEQILTQSYARVRAGELVR